MNLPVQIYGRDRKGGWFECSDPLVNHLHENIVWSMRGNFFDIPTDCPQRDEHLGCTGDLQIFSPVASFLFDTYGFLALRRVLATLPNADEVLMTIADVLAKLG
jgi:hypothetical protein